MAELPQNSSIDSTQSTNDQSGPENANGDHLAESLFPRKVSVSVADAGETAVVVSMIGEEPNENFQSMLEIEKGVGNEAFNPYGGDRNAKSESNERTDIQSMLQAQEPELSFSQDASFCLPSTSLGSSEVKTDSADEKLNEQSSCDGVKSFLGKTFNEPYPGNKPSDCISNVDLHLGLSMSKSGNFVNVIIVHFFIFKLNNCIITVALTIKFAYHFHILLHLFSFLMSF